MILDPNTFGGDIRGSIEAFALTATARVYVIDEFEAPDYFP